jgi:hypothetical protein
MDALRNAPPDERAWVEALSEGGAFLSGLGDLDFEPVEVVDLSE